jgi:hypothetical protein
MHMLSTQKKYARPRLNHHPLPPFRRVVQTTQLSTIPTATFILLKQHFHYPEPSTITNNQPIQPSLATTLSNHHLLQPKRQHFGPRPLLNQCPPATILESPNHGPLQASSSLRHCCLQPSFPKQSPPQQSASNYRPFQPSLGFNIYPPPFQQPFTSNNRSLPATVHFQQPFTSSNRSPPETVHLQQPSTYNHRHLQSAPSNRRSLRHRPL